MTLQTSISFTLPTTNTDGSPLTEALTATAYIDTVNPPVKSYAVPAKDITGAVNGLVTSTFAELGFAPAKNTDYYCEVTVTDADGTSAPTPVVAFKYSVVPAAPTGLKVF